MTDAMINALQRKAVARAQVIKQALNCAADTFNAREDDPGWEADMHDDMLHTAIHEYVGECNFVKELEHKERQDALREQANSRIEGPS